MQSTTLKHYKDNYQTNLDTYLDSYEDNTEFFFLENELVKYQAYHNALVVFQKDLFINTDKETTMAPLNSGVTKILKNNNLTVYNDIVTEIPDLNCDPKLRIWNDMLSFDLVKLQNYISSSIRIVEYINERINHINSYRVNNANRIKASPYTTVVDEKYKSENWFRFGILLAKGELNKFYDSSKKVIKSDYSALAVAIELGDKNFEKYVLATLNNYSSDSSNANKNIYNSKNKMVKIIEYCKENQITVDTNFSSRLPED